MAFKIRGATNLNGVESRDRGAPTPLDLEEFQMRMILLGVLLFIFWTGFYAMLQRLTDDTLIVVAFTAALVVSMVSAAVALARSK